MKLIVAAITACFLFLGSFTSAAESAEVSGVVTHINIDKRTLTIRNERTGKRRTYFLASDTRVSSNGQPMSLASVKKGNMVSLRYRETDQGREITSFRVPDPSEIVEIIPVEVTEELTISGTVTGVRPALRTLTIREDETRQRQTLTLPDGVRISREGRPIRLSGIEKGDQISARYRVTDRGWIIVTGRSPRPDPVAKAQPVLPKTAGQQFYYLAVGFVLLGSAALLAGARIRSEKSA